MGSGGSRRDVAFKQENTVRILLPLCDSAHRLTYAVGLASVQVSRLRWSAHHDPALRPHMQGGLFHRGYLARAVVVLHTGMRSDADGTRHS